MEQDIRDITSILNGETERYRRLIEKYTPRLSRLVISQGVPEIEQEDLVHEVFIRAYTSLSRFRLDKRFDLWLMGIAVKTIQDFWRHYYRRKEILPPAADESHGKHLENIVSHHPEPLDKLLREEAKENILRSLDLLTVDQRLATTLFYFDEMTIGEIGKTTRWSESKIKVLLHRSREKLKLHIQNYFSEEPVS